MLFRRKKKKATELREHYRRAPGKKHPLGLTVQVAGQAPLQAKLKDLSAGGAGVHFDPQRDPKLEVGHEAVLSFISLSSGHQIVAPATVMSVRGAEAEGHTYGFQFKDVPGLFAQLDSYFVRFFNRRKALRVLPALGKRLPIQAQVGGEVVKVPVNDISWMGIGFLLEPAAAERFLEVDAFVAEFSLPKLQGQIQATVQLVHKTLTGSKVLFGGYFLEAGDSKFDPARKLLNEYVKAREADMARWDSVV